MAQANLDPEQARIKLEREFSGPKPKKSQERSLQLKEQGNIYFKQSRWHDALECYSEAIVS